MQNPTDQAKAEAPIPIKTESNDADTNCTVAAHRKAAKRTLPWDLVAGELHLMSSQPPQNEEIPAPARKKPRLEEPVPTTRDQAARKTASPEVSVDLPPPGADIDNANAYSVTDTQPKPGAYRRRWTLEEDAKLTSAVASTLKMKWGKDYKKNWAAISTLVPGRTKHQCLTRWEDVLDPSIDRANRRTGKWAEDEDSKLKDAVQRHGDKDWGAVTALVPGRTQKQCRQRWKDALDPSIGRASGRKVMWTLEEDTKLTSAVANTSKKRRGKEYKIDWDAISALVPGRTKNQCRRRWYNALDPSIDRANGRTGPWSEDEDIKLKDAVQTHGGKDWTAIAKLVPGRTEKQCRDRWKFVLDPIIDRAGGRWTAVEDIKLKDAVQTHDGKNWGAIAALVPGRTEKQCRGRWPFLDPNIVGSSGRTGPWSDDEDIKLKDAVQRHGGKDWDTIAALVPRRTRNQCSTRWHTILDTNIDPTTARAGRWTVDEDKKLKDAVPTHGGTDWAVIAALIPGRTLKQCHNRWDRVLNPSIDRANGRTGRWVEDEDIKLKVAVQAHGSKNWDAVAALVPGRTRKQCRRRWQDVLDPNIDWANGRTGT
jgi:hypothetical protein